MGAIDAAAETSESDRARFAAQAARMIRRERRNGVAAVDGTVARLVAQTGDMPEAEAEEARLAIYDTAVRASSSAWAAGQALDLLLSRPAGIGSSEAALSRALFFAIACGRRDDLQRRMDGMHGEYEDPASRFNIRMACAKLSLVYDEPHGVRQHATRAIHLPVQQEDAGRARRLRHVACWLGREPRTGISQWRLRPLHPLLTREAAERLEEGDLMLPDADRLPAVRRALQAASERRRVAERIAEDPNGDQPKLRQALAGWALEVGRYLMGAEDADACAAVAFTATAWRLLEPGPPADVVDAHVRAVARACAVFPEPLVATAARAVADAMPAPTSEFVPAVLEAWKQVRGPDADDLDGAEERVVRLLGRAAAERPRPSLETALPDVANRLAGMPAEAVEAIETCLMDRAWLLPDEPPFRGSAYFASRHVHRRYEHGRDESDPTASYRAFEEAWKLEPNNRFAVQGLIYGLRRRLGPKPSRDHLLRHFADVLDQIVEHEVEAALAYTALADLATLARHQRRRRRYLEAAVAALQRRLRRSAWTKARNAEIAILLELGSLKEAGTAAWEESRLYLPGSEASKRYALLAAELWERSGTVDEARQLQISAARAGTRHAAPSPQAAVQYAVEARRLILLRDEQLDQDALEDLLWACRGNEDELFRFLEKQASRRIDPRPEYEEFLDRERPKPARPAHPAPDGRYGLDRLRLAAAEVLSRDPLHELAISTDSLTERHLSEFIALLRECAGPDEGAVHAFVVAVHQALSTLFELRAASPTITTPELYGARLSAASLSLGQVRLVADQFHEPVAQVLHLLSRHLSLSLELPMIDAYLGEKGKRLVASTLSTRIGGWWVDICAGTGELDFFHHHKAYQCPSGRSPEEWWANHQVNGRPVQEAVRDLLGWLEARAKQLTAIDAYYRSYRRRQPGPPGFGLSAELERCCATLRAALQPGAGPAELRRIAGALEALSTSLRRIDMARLNPPDLLYDGLPQQVYVLPRADELLSHWRKNAGAVPHRQFVFEVQDDAFHDALCIMCVDSGNQPVPETVKLRGLEPFADLVEALGGKFHLWVARAGEPGGCRIDHADGETCTADEYVHRIVERLQELAVTWPLRHAEVQSWLAHLDAALRARGNVAVAFAILPRTRE